MNKVTLWQGWWRLKYVVYQPGLQFDLGYIEKLDHRPINRSNHDARPMIDYRLVFRGCAVFTVSSRRLARPLPDAYPALVQFAEQRSCFTSGTPAFPDRWVNAPKSS